MLSRDSRSAINNNVREGRGQTRVRGGKCGAEWIFIEDETMQDELETSTKQKKNRKILRRACDTDFLYQCEWSDCVHESTSMNEFNHHISLHRLAYTQHLMQEPDEEFIFYCQWRDCNAQIEGKLEEFTRHVYYHTFHQYLKFLGKHIQTVEGMAPCLLDSASRNLIPELPEKLMCRWQDCYMVYDNPYIFYSHVGHHAEDIPRENRDTEPVVCKWEGCKTVIKSWYKMREHMRSHTQAKIVACPTCGSLFANNTRFIDHLMRQLQSGFFDLINQSFMLVLAQLTPAIQNLGHLAPVPCSTCAMKHLCHVAPAPCNTCAMKHLCHVAKWLAVSGTMVRNFTRKYAGHGSFLRQALTQSVRVFYCCIHTSGVTECPPHFK
ncbi:histone h4 transcription factor [Plakobranchus ocellatus]|uniref:Histone h4 transcription factor n=1 Tax=Plakobranchus ocellatus TaxID=259542 RepID=A0AAV4AW40_9GAST|nr:histone h4 transcription factor [Plakobranchus ocellatus]